MLSKEELLTATEEAFIDDEQLAYIRELLFDMGLPTKATNSIKLKPKDTRKDKANAEQELSSV